MPRPSAARSTSSQRSTCRRPYTAELRPVLHEPQPHGIALAQAGAVFSRRQPGVTLEAAREVTLVAEARGIGDLAEPRRTDQLTARKVDAQLPDVGGDGRLMHAAERAREVDRVNADRFRHGGERERLAETLFDERHRDQQPDWHAWLRGRLVAARRLGEHAERQAFDRQPRYLVALAELAVEPMREVEKQPAAKRHRSTEQRRLLPGASQPRIVHVDDQAARATG